MRPPSENDCPTTDHVPGTPTPDPNAPTNLGPTLSTAERGTINPTERSSGSISVPGYEVLGVLGRGGMGVVYKARHLALKRIVALKMILAGGHAGPHERTRFRIEAEAVARLQHPSIVQIHEVGEVVDDVSGAIHPYCALEFVEGGNLTEKIKGKPLPVRDAARLVETLARAMQLAHSRNVVHRDLKPANILLARPGPMVSPGREPGAVLIPKITDFGLARQTDSDSGETRDGAVMGTPSYMAPEQASGRTHEAGPAADVYALGAILYECLTGRPPFQGKTTIETLDQVRTQEPVPPSRFQARVPRDLETICLKCLAKEPEKRYASAAELADDLVRYQQGEPIRARPVGAFERAVKWTRRNPVVTAAALAVVLALSVGATVSYLNYRHAEEQRAFAEERQKEAEQARDFLVSIFELSDINGQRGTMTARQILDDAEKNIPLKFANQPRLKADLLGAVDGVYARITEKSPLAMVLETGGTVQVLSSREPTQGLVPQQLLHAGDRLRLAADAHVHLLLLYDLHHERLQPGTEVTVHRKGCQPVEAVSPWDNDPVWTFVPLTRATFYMGWGRDDGKAGVIRQGVKTEIKEDFEIAVHTVTQGQWQTVMGSNPSAFSRLGPRRISVKDVSDEELKLLPVESVSLSDVQEFIKKLNERTQDTGYRYRLPTEAEYEYACRGGATTEAECSFDYYFDKPTNDFASQPSKFRFASSRPTRVGAYPPNKLGLCDMHGNMGQWSDSIKDNGVYKVQLLLGGSWSSSGPLCRAAYRHADTPVIRSPGIGFRLVRVRQPAEAIK